MNRLDLWAVTMNENVFAETLRILVVEDEEAHAELICRAFDEGAGNRYKVTVVRTLREARENISKSEPNLVIADLLLPDGKGIDLFSDYENNGLVPLIVMTSHGTEQVAVEALKKGALDYVVKSDSAFLDMPRTADRALREWGHIRDSERAEQELRAQEEELGAIYENAPLIMMLVDSDRRVRKANAAAATFADRPSSGMEGLRGGEALRCLNSLDDPNGCGFGQRCQSCPIRRTVMDTLDTGHNHHQVEASLPFSVRGTRKEVYFLLSSTRVTVRQQPMALVSILDITARKRAEKALKESEELFRAIFDNHHVVMLIIDPDTGKVCDASPGACKFYGYARKEIKTKTVFEIDVDSTEEITQRMREAKSGPLKYFGFRHRLASGEVREVEVCSGPIVVAGKTLLFSVVNDVTDRKNAEAALRESEERFRAVFESAGESIFIKDHSLRYTHVNPAMCKLLDLPAAKIVGMRSEDIYDEETAKQLIEREARS